MEQKRFTLSNHLSSRFLVRFVRLSCLKISFCKVIVFGRVFLLWHVSLYKTSHFSEVYILYFSYVLPKVVVFYVMFQASILPVSFYVLSDLNILVNVGLISKFNYSFKSISVTKLEVNDAIVCSVSNHPVNDVWVLSLWITSVSV